MSEYVAELTAQMHSAADAVTAAKRLGDDPMAAAMRARLDDLSAIASRHQVPA
jgi:hypothetical protein